MGDNLADLINLYRTETGLELDTDTDPTGLSAKSLSGLVAAAQPSATEALLTGLIPTAIGTAVGALSGAPQGALIGLGGGASGGAQAIKMQQDLAKEQATAKFQGALLTGRLSKQERDEARKEEQLGIAKERLALEKQKAVTEREKAKETKEAKKEEMPASKYLAAGYARAAEQAQSVFDDLEQQGYGRESRYQETLGILPGELQPEELRRQTQAELSFVEAVLRRKSGATITPAEISKAQKQYFPRPGDSEKIIAQKKANRIQEIKSLQAEAGKALQLVPLIGAETATAPAPTKKFPGTKEAVANERPATIIQNGFIYYLNPQTGKYE